MRGEHSLRSPSLQALGAMECFVEEDILLGTEILLYETRERHDSAYCT